MVLAPNRVFAISVVVLFVLVLAHHVVVAAASRPRRRVSSLIFPQARPDARLQDASHVVVPFEPLTPLNASAANISFSYPTLLRLPLLVVAVFEGTNADSPHQPSLYVSTSASVDGTDLQWTTPSPVSRKNADGSGMWSPALYYDERTSTVFLYYTAAVGNRANGTVFVVWSRDNARTWSSPVPVAVTGPSGDPLFGFVSGGNAVGIPTWLGAASSPNDGRQWYGGGGNKDGAAAVNASSWVFLFVMTAAGVNDTNGTFLVEAKSTEITNVTYTVSHEPVFGDEFTSAALALDGANGGIAVVAVSRNNKNNKGNNSALACRVAPFAATLVDAEWSAIETLSAVTVPSGKPFSVVSPATNVSWIALVTVSDDKGNASGITVTAVDALTGQVAQSGSLTFSVFGLDPAMKSIAVTPLAVPGLTALGNSNSTTTTRFLLTAVMYGFLADAVVDLDVVMPKQLPTNEPTPTTAMVVTFSIIGGVVVILTAIFARGKWCSRGQYDHLEATTLLREHHVAAQQPRYTTRDE